MVTVTNGDAVHIDDGDTLGYREDDDYDVGQVKISELVAVSCFTVVLSALIVFSLYKIIR